MLSEFVSHVIIRVNEDGKQTDDSMCVRQSSCRFKLCDSFYRFPFTRRVV